MTFRDFLRLHELAGQFGDVKAHHGPLQLIKQQAKMVRPVRGKGSTVGRMLSAGGPTSPARPAKITSVHGPLTHPSFLK